MHPLHWLGLDGGAPAAWWQGPGSDLGYLAVIGGLWRKHNCHRRRCWRIGRHQVDGTPWCDKHHQAARKTESGVR
jgi:hypothetical protein